MLDRPQKPGSIGMALPGTKIKIVDEKGSEVPRGKIGELIVCGDNVMQGYYKDKKATASVIKDGWLYTGDLGKMDDEDYIFLTGLKKRMIITSGFNVYPKEIEDVLNLHPAVKKSRVIGKQDLMRGEIVKAEIFIDNGSIIDEKEILKHCRMYLSAYKIPREVEFAEAINS
jgi:long-chain acyl-CoA synthetase